MLICYRIAAAYAGNGDGNDALGVFFTAFFICKPHIFTMPVGFLTIYIAVSVIMTIGSIRASVAITTLWASIFMTFLLVMISTFREQEKVLKASGGFGILTATVAYYCGAAGLWVKQAAFFDLPTGNQVQAKY
jgi:succinate-acetate transporter protein